MNEEERRRKGRREEEDGRKGRGKRKERKRKRKEQKKGRETTKEERKGRERKQRLSFRKRKGKEERAYLSVAWAGGVSLLGRGLPLHGVSYTVEFIHIQ